MKQGFTRARERTIRRRRRSFALTAIACLAAFAVVAGAQAAQSGDDNNSPAAATAASGPGITSIAKQSFAVVGSDGTLARGTPDILSSSRIAAGAYQVLTNHDVQNCAYVADPGVTGSTGAVGAPAFTVTALRAGTTTGVFVNAFDRTGASADFPFHLHIDCNVKQRWAVVNGDGTIARKSLKVTGAIHIGTGVYEVDFARPVSKCAYTANVGNPGAGNPAALTISLASRAGNNLGVFVEIQNTSGAPTDASFHLDVACGRAPLYGVVDSAGTRIRGTATAATHLAAGAYEVDFAQNVSGCAYVASVAQPGTGVAPQGTATVAGRNGNPQGVFVQTFDLAGNQVDRPFHLIVYC